MKIQDSLDRVNFINHRNLVCFHICYIYTFDVFFYFFSLLFLTKLPKKRNLFPSQPLNDTENSLYL